MTVIAHNNPLSPADYILDTDHAAMSIEALAEKHIGQGVFALPNLNGEWIADWKIIVKPSDTLVFCSDPRGGDEEGGGKNVMRVIAQVALIAAASYIAPMAAGTMFATGTTAYSVASQVIQAGLMFVGGIAINALLPQQQKANENLKSLTPQNNVARIGSPMSQVFGEFLVYPDLALAPYTEFDKNIPKLEEYFHLTIGKADISRQRLGTTPVNDIDKVTTTIYQDNYVPTRFVIPEAQGVEILAPQDEDKDNWSGNEGWSQWFEMCPPYETLAGGLFGRNFQLNINFPKGVKDFGTPINASTVNGEFYKYYDGFEIEIAEINDQGMQISSVVTDLLIPEKPSKVSRGADYTASIVFIANDYNAIAGVGKLKSGEMHWPYAYAPIRAKFRIRRNIRKDKDAADESIARIASAWGLSTTQQPLDGMMVKLNAGQMKRLPSNGGQTFNAIVKRYINGFTKSSNGSFIHTGLGFNNYSAMVIFHLLYERFNEDMTRLAKQVDLVSLWELYQENIANNERFNAHIKEKIRYWDLIGQICFGMKVKSVIRGGKISFARSRKPLAPNFVITPYDTVKDSLTDEFKFNTSNDVYDGVKIEYVEANIWQHNHAEAKIQRHGVTQSIRPQNPMVMDGMGITNYQQAKKIADHMAKSIQHNKRHISFETEKDGLLINVNDVVEVSILEDENSAKVIKMEGRKVWVDRPIDRHATNATIRLDGAKPSQLLGVNDADYELFHSGLPPTCTEFELSEVPRLNGQPVELNTAQNSDVPDTITFYRDNPVWLRVTSKKPTKNGARISGFVENMKVYED